MFLMSIFIVSCEVGKFKKDEIHTAAVSNLLLHMDLDAVPTEDNDDSQGAPDAVNVDNATTAAALDQGDATTGSASLPATSAEAASADAAAAAASCADDMHAKEEKQMECLMTLIREMRGEVAIDLEEETNSDEASKMSGRKAIDDLGGGEKKVLVLGSCDWAEQHLETMEHNMLLFRKQGSIGESEERPAKKLRRQCGSSDIALGDFMEDVDTHLDPELPTVLSAPVLPEPAEPSGPVVPPEQPVPVIQAELGYS